MPNTVEYIGGRIDESNADVTENPRGDGVERIKKAASVLFGVYASASAHITELGTQTSGINRSTYKDFVSAQSHTSSRTTSMAVDQTLYRRIVFKIYFRIINHPGFSLN